MTEIRLRPGSPAVAIAMAVLLASALVGCSVGPDPLPALPSNPTAQPSARPATTAAASPSGSVEPGPAWEPTGDPIVVDPTVVAAAVESDGVRLTIAVPASPLTAAAPSWILTTLENLGPDPIHWITDGCAIHVGVRGIGAIRWTRGRPQDGPSRTFKNWALDVDPGGADRPIELDLTPEAHVGRGDLSCADLGVPHELAAGGRIQERTLFEGLAALGYGPAPTGPTMLQATFDFWNRDGEEMGARPELVARLPIDIVDGRDPHFLSPGQAIDVALGAPALRQILADNPSLQDWDMPVTVEVDPSAAIWLIGVKAKDGTSVLVRVDPIGARILDVTAR